jgi:hypothetical protein
MGSLPRQLSRLSPKQRLASVAGAVALGVATLLGGWIAFRVWLTGARRGLRVLRWLVLVTTLRLYRPCPECHKYVHADARICHRCGYSKRHRPRASRI